jgi:hypothetical protein
MFAKCRWTPLHHAFCAVAFTYLKMGHENEKSTFYGGLASGMNAGMKQARRIGTEYAIPGNVES